MPPINIIVPFPIPRVSRWQWILCGIVTIKGGNEEENVVRWGGGGGRG